MEMQVVSLVILEISRQLGSDSCQLMATIEVPGFTTQIWSYGFEVNPKRWENVIENRIDFLSLRFLVCSFNSRYFSFFLIEDRES